MLKAKEKFNYWVRVANDLYNITEQNDISMDLQEQWEESDSSDEENKEEKQKKQKINPYSKIEYFINKTLLRKYEYINKESILYYFLNADHKEYKNWNEKTFIYPFGINNSQKKAVENAFKSNISIIQGPPGTGKAQTILNILANILMENKTAAVVSNNNSAIDNVVEKMHAKINKQGKKQNEIDDIWFLTSFLGKKQNNEKYFSEKYQAEIFNA
ncbi:DNA helicase [Mesoplasma tabanidae]|uniref:DNA helicase n=1 Tax=Mesoplasma tabanidae TaxID=219745 RepID=A0A2K8P460_9MOLU|nr:AAA domain-containing protein [Mesoplasma tabanidae]ATZ21537.1 DNA helicase [Mesoplasma tabanidae]